MIGGVGLGAALAYLYDPEMGNRRRAMIRDKAVRALNKTGEAVETTARDVQHRLIETVLELRSRVEEAGEEVGDEVVRDLPKGGAIAVGFQGTDEAEHLEPIQTTLHQVLAEADASPLLCAILTSARDADNELLPMLTTRSAPVLDAATRTLISWFTEHFPQLDPQDLADGVDALVRLAVSHLVLPADDQTTTARSLARIALRTLRLDST